MMAERTLSVSLTGDAAAFVTQEENKGIKDKELVARALSLLKLAIDNNNKIAILDEQGKIKDIFRVFPSE